MLRPRPSWLGASNLTLCTARQADGEAEGTRDREKGQGGISTKLVQWRAAEKADLNIARQVDGELGGSEDVLGLGPGWQGVAWGYPPDEGALAGLAHAKVACVQHSKPHLHKTIQYGSGKHTASRQ